MKLRPRERKAKMLEEIKKLLESYKTVAVADIHGIKAAQFKEIRSKIDGVVKVAKKNIIRLALEQLKDKMPGIENLSLEGMPALIFTNENPFKLAAFLRRNMVPAYAKAGQIAPKDITIPAGPTPFPAGPMVSQLSQMGLKVRVEGGKIVVVRDKVIVKQGEVIDEKVADLLAKFDIKPMLVGLKLVSAWEDGFVYSKEALAFDEEKFLEELSQAASYAFNLAIGIAWPTPDTIDLLLTKAIREAMNLGIELSVVDAETLPFMLAKAHAQAKALQEKVS